MKRRSFVITLAALAMLVMASTAQAGPPSSPFTGTWMGFDLSPTLGGDGSTEHLVVRGGNNARIDYEDEFGSVCWDVGSTDYWFTSTLSGDVSGNTMTGVFKSAKCGHISVPWLKGQTMVWTLDTKGNNDPSDDTLSDGTVTWSRV